MKSNLNVAGTGGAMAALILTLMGDLRGEGPLDPPGAPAPTMKTLQEIWDKIGELEGQIEDLRTFLGAPFTMEMVTVGDAGNAADTTGFGAVSYEYKIGKYEVTNAQYAAFLNAVAATDSNGLYTTSMTNDDRGGIVRSGSSGSYTYTVKPFMGDKPVNFVMWYDAARFCNWLHNGRPTGPQNASTTEDGAYTMTGFFSIQLPGSDPVHGANGRNAGARFHLPSRNEWYKAAYYELGGDADDYWLYPTRSNGVPTKATADASGNIDNDTANIANYDKEADWNGLDGNVTTVGSGGAGSQSFYGAADMGGNVAEWTEELSGSNRGWHGGHWSNVSTLMRSTFGALLSPTVQNFANGFRVASP